MASKKRAKDFHRFLRSVESFSDGQAKVVDWDSDTLEWVMVELRPSDGPYKGGRYKFEITMHEDYPNSAPDCNCITNIYHPNIDPESESSNICLSLLDEWQPTFGLDDLITGLLWLLNYPNIEDPLSPYFDPSMETDEFLQNVADSLRGKDVEGINFGVNFWEGDILLKLEALVITEGAQNNEKTADSNSETDNSGANSDSADRVEEANSQNTDTKEEVNSQNVDIIEEVPKNEKCEPAKDAMLLVDNNASSADANAEGVTGASNSKTDTDNTQENKGNETDSNDFGADIQSCSTDMQCVVSVPNEPCDVKNDPSGTQTGASDTPSTVARSDEICDIKTDCVQNNAQASTTNDTKDEDCASFAIEPLELNMVDIAILDSQPADSKVCDFTGDDTMGGACDVTMVDPQVTNDAELDNTMTSCNSQIGSITQETPSNSDTNSNASDNDSFHDCFAEFSSSSGSTDTTSQSSSDISTSTEASSSTTSTEGGVCRRDFFEEVRLLRELKEEDKYKIAVGTDANFDFLEDYDDAEYDREHYNDSGRMRRMRRMSERQRREENECKVEDETQQDECEKEEDEEEDFDDCEEEQGEIINGARRKKVDHTVSADVLNVDDMIRRVEELMLTAVDDVDEDTVDPESTPKVEEEQLNAPSFLDGDAASASAGAAGSNDEIMQQTETNNNQCTCGNPDSCDNHHGENQGIIRQLSKVDRQLSVKTPMEESGRDLDTKRDDFGRYLDMYGTCTFVDPAFDRYVAVVTSTVAYAWDSVVR